MLLWGMNCYYRVQNSPPLVPILRQINPAPILTLMNGQTSVTFHNKASFLAFRHLIFFYNKPSERKINNSYVIVVTKPHITTVNLCFKYIFSSENILTCYGFIQNLLCFTHMIFYMPD